MRLPNLAYVSEQNGNEIVAHTEYTDDSGENKSRREMGRFVRMETHYLFQMPDDRRVLGVPEMEQLLAKLKELNTEAVEPTRLPRVVNKFQDGKGNVAEMLTYTSSRTDERMYGVRLVKCGHSLMNLEHIGHVHGQSVYHTSREGERTHDTVYACTDGTREHCIAYMKERGFDLRGEQ